MKIKITEYGLSIKAGGWDTYGDSGTDNWQGNRNNRLSRFSCALTQSAQDGLSAQSGDILKIVFDNGKTLYRSFDDRAPEDEPRLDMFFPIAFVPMPSEFAEVTVEATS